jgi:hypothetical protein
MQTAPPEISLLSIFLMIAGIYILVKSPRKLQTLGRMALTFLVTVLLIVVVNAILRIGDPQVSGPFDWIGFAVRFVVGALFGALVSFRVMIDLALFHPNLIPVGVAATILVCALASELGGDAFWRAIRPSGLWRWGRWN